MGLWDCGPRWTCSKLSAPLITNERTSQRATRGDPLSSGHSGYSSTLSTLSTLSNAESRLKSGQPLPNQVQSTPSVDEAAAPDRGCLIKYATRLAGLPFASLCPPSVQPSAVPLVAIRRRLQRIEYRGQGYHLHPSLSHFTLTHESQRTAPRKASLHIFQVQLNVARMTDWLTSG